MDDFYLPEETIEWLSQKKSEYLSLLIQNLESDDYQFEDYAQFEELLPMTLAAPDWSWEKIEDGQRVKTFCRSFHQGRFVQQIVVGALIPDQSKNDVFVPIITFVTKKENLIKFFSDGKTGRGYLN